jgi:hypothetical protein
LSSFDRVTISRPYVLQDVPRSNQWAAGFECDAIFAAVKGQYAKLAYFDLAASAALQIPKIGRRIADNVRREFMSLTTSRPSKSFRRQDEPIPCTLNAADNRQLGVSQSALNEQSATVTAVQVVKQACISAVGAPTAKDCSPGVLQTIGNGHDHGSVPHNKIVFGFILRRLNPNLAATAGLIFAIPGLTTLVPVIAMLDAPAASASARKAAANARSPRLCSVIYSAQILTL